MDLSAYELARLQRIKENKAVIAKLGLKRLQPKPKKISKSTKAAETIKKRERAKRKRSIPPTKSTRRSKRIRGKSSDGASLAYDDNADITNNGDDVEDVEPFVDYTDGNWPISPEFLDDYEFQCYASLRRWRLLRKNELEIEPYKICQNRTICELIRRKRNTCTYATDTIESDLLACWGIGPSKAKEGGYGYEMLEELAKDEVCEWLKQSRALSETGDGSGSSSSSSNT